VDDGLALLYRLCTLEAELRRRLPAPTGAIEYVYAGKSAGREGVVIEGLASTIDPDLDDDVIDPRAYDAAIAAANRRALPLPLTFGHARELGFDQPWSSKDGFLQLGTIERLWKTTRGLMVRAFVPRPAPGSFLEDVYGKVKAGVLRGLSVGGKLRRGAGGRITAMELAEISVVPGPANVNAFITSVSPTGVATAPRRWDRRFPGV
jgi:hypothetical protein